MKKFVFFVFLISLFISCQTDEMPQSTGAISFSLLNKIREENRTTGVVTPAFVLLSVKNEAGEMVLENKKLPLFSFGQSYVSENIELPLGNYKLTQFVVLDAANKTIYATPIEGSELAKYVEDPLPISFTVFENKTSLVVPQVLEIEPNDMPENFGYVSFGFEIISLKGVYFYVPNSYNITKISYEFANELERYSGEITSASGLVSFNLNALGDKKWNTIILVWLVKDNCVQKIIRFKGNIDFKNKTSVKLPPLNDNAWKSFYYSSISKNNEKVDIYRSVDYKNVYVEIYYPNNLKPYYGYAAMNYFDAGGKVVCNYSSHELALGGNPEIAQLPYTCSSGQNPFYIESTIILDLPVLGFREDYFVWTSDGKPYCGDF